MGRVTNKRSPVSTDFGFELASLLVNDELLVSST